LSPEERRPSAALAALAAVFLVLALGLLRGQAAPASAFQEPTTTLLPDPYATGLPTPRPIPVSAWRPALYPVPWALSPYDHFYFTRPIAADEVNWPLDAYRYTGTNFSADLPHTGVDIVASPGTPVLAAAAGQVVWADWGLFRLTPGDTTDPYGKAVVIAHDFGFLNQPLFTVYAHLSAIDVVRGQEVDIGEVIGRVGRTGLATADHLHFEVRWGLNDFYASLNPELWLVPPEGWGVLAGRVMTTWGDPVFNQRVKVTNLDTRQSWWAQTYSTFKNINRDPNFQENFVLSDLPAGNYEVSLPYVGREIRARLRIEPGAVTFFTFHGFRGFNVVEELPYIPTTLPIYQPSPTP
jgi:murein DD-endopeptidase MepM/ murein hydrolase activator NlpD